MHNFISSPGNPGPSHDPSDISQHTFISRESGDPQSSLLTGLFILALFYTLYVTRAFLLPIILTFLLSFLLKPAVGGLKKLRIPEPIGAALTLFALLGILAYGVYLLSEPAARWIEQAPQAARQIEFKLRPLKKPVEQVAQATEEIEKIAGTEKEERAQAVKITRIALNDMLFSQTPEFLATMLVMIVLLYFLLASGDLIPRKLAGLLTQLNYQHEAMMIIDEIGRRISVYLGTVTVINIGLGATVTVAMILLGMPNPLLWGVLAGLLNFIPYLGALVGVIVLSLVAILTFETLAHALLVSAVYIVLTTFEGYFLTPAILGRQLTLNPVTLFIGVIFWGWLWGIGGILLAVPILATFKIFCDHFKPLSPIGEFLGR